MWIDTKDRLKGPADHLLVRKSTLMEKAGYGSQCDEEDTLNLVDQVNLLYVAFTRAVHELYGFIQKKRNGINELMLDVISQMEGWQPFANKLVRGQHTVIDSGYHKPQSEPADNQKKIDSYQATLLRKSSSRERRYGTLLHELLEHIHDVNDIPLHLERIAKNYELSQSEASQLKTDVEGLLSNPSIRKLVLGEVGMRTMGEQSLVGSDGKVIRPDKLFLTDKKAIVVEFKTGLEERSEHARQVIEYADLLKEMGYRDVEGHLVYTATRQVVKVL